MKKLLSTAVTVGILTSTSLFQIALADSTVVPASNALPNPVANYKSINENVDFSTNGNKMTIEVGKGVTGAVGTAHWDSFNIGSDATVQVNFTAHHQTSLNKVSGTEVSKIYGNLLNGTACAGGTGCNYQDTSKIILLNPNGIIFGKGANVNVNSFTASTFDGVYNKGTENGVGVLNLTRNKNKTSSGITVGHSDGTSTSIYGDKNVALASDNITIYNGSKISTNTSANDVTSNGESFGKVKLVTSDGVNFEYYNNGTIHKVNNITNSSDKMIIGINGNISSGNIDIRNNSTHSESEINTKGAVLKAYKAEKGNDGNILLTSSNKITANNSSFRTEYDPNGDATKIAARKGSNNNPYGNVEFKSGNGVTVNNKSAINAVGNVTLSSLNSGEGHDVIIDDASTKIETGYDVLLDSSNVASVQNSSAIRAKNITVKGAKGAYVSKSSLTTKDYGNGDIVILASDGTAWANDARVYSGNDINIEATKGAVNLEGASTFEAAKNINITANKTIDTDKISNSTYKAGNNINVTSTGNDIILTGFDPFKQYNELNLKAAKDIQIYKDDADLTVEKVSLDAGNDITLKSTNNNLIVKDTTKFKNAKNIYLTAGKNVTTSGNVDVNNLKTNINAGNDIDVTLLNVGNREKGLVAKAKKNVTITTPGTLSVSSLIAENGNMTLNADKVIAGKEYVADSAKIPGDTSDIRSFISVENGTFTSNTKNDAFYVTASDTPLNDGTNRYMRHHIQYGNGTEKIVLRNPRPYMTPPVPVTPGQPTPSDPGQGGDDNISVDDSQARMLNKIPRSPEIYNNQTNIADGRTTFVDVFAAASQIEIEDDEN